MEFINFQKWNFDFIKWYVVSIFVHLWVDIVLKKNDINKKMKKHIEKYPYEIRHEYTKKYKL